jgi:hypothetical protein
VSATETLKAAAIASGYSLSDVASATYTINLPVDFTLTSSPTSITIYTGESAKYTVTIAPSNGFELPVSLTCSQLPANTTCTFSPSIIPSDSKSSTLFVQTSAPKKVSSASSLSGPLCGTALAGFLLLLIPRQHNRSRKLWGGMWAIATMCLLGYALSGCAAPESVTGGTPVGEQNIVITATATNGSQTLVRTTTVKVNVKSMF